MLLAAAAVLCGGWVLALQRLPAQSPTPVYSFLSNLGLQEVELGDLQISVTVEPGHTLADLWVRYRLTPQQFNLLTSLQDADVLRRLRPHDQLQFTLTPNRDLATLRFKRGGYEVVFTQDLGGFSAYSRRLQSSQRLRYAVIRVTDSFSHDVRQAGLPAELLEDLGELLNWGVDLSEDVGPGDRLRLVYEETQVEERPTGAAGDVLFAEHIPAEGEPYSVLRYQRGEEVGHFNPDGSNIRKAFLRVPLRHFLRISSNYDLQRLHPVLHEVRAHVGVDYAAPVGTEVLAAGDGEVIFAGQVSGYGNLIILKHANNYFTRYAHLNHFAPGITRKSVVKQGQTIAYVGTTGMSTGPHLHYEFRTGRNGEIHTDPVVVDLPNASPLVGEEAIEVRVRSQQMARRLDMFERLDEAQVCHSLSVAEASGGC